MKSRYTYKVPLVSLEWGVEKTQADHAPLCEFPLEWDERGQVPQEVQEVDQVPAGYEDGAHTL